MNSDLAAPVDNVNQGRIASLGTTYEITLRFEKTERKEEEKRHFRRLTRWGLHKASKTTMPEERIKQCMSRPLPNRQSVDVLKSKQATHYSGLTTCGSVWICPICAAKISERRRRELKETVTRANVKGLQAVLLTQTVPHYSHQRLKPLLAKFQAARTKQRQRRSWQRLVDRYGIAGNVRALEITHGENGWHIHTHEILFLQPVDTVNLPALEGEIFNTWLEACQAAKLDPPSQQHGVDLRDGSCAANYVNKWGMEEELTKSHVKHGRGDNRTPWDFLRGILETGDCDDVDLFREFAKAFKGKRQLVWSRGLRDYLGLDAEATDQELAARDEEQAELLGSLTLEQWRLILSREVRGEVLEIARVGGWSGVLAFLERLQRKVH